MKGYTLLELVIVVALLGIVAAVAVPAVMPPDRHKLELAASRVADAMRFAREEARRSGSVHGLSVDLVNNRVDVFRLDDVPNPNLKVFDVRDPISKQLYSIDLDAAPHRHVAASALGGVMQGACNDPGNIGIDRNGVTRCVEPLTTRVSNANIQLQLGEHRLTVAVDSYTGRVSIQ